jgi:hypothetical protein
MNSSTGRRRGNPGWTSGRVPDVPPAGPTEFEVLVSELNLTEKTYERSLQLLDWCKHNRNRRYVPEWLLKTWGLCVDSDRLSI